jgi:NADH dehydrogenase/NADH:ubiquinone oxidoreductase subunit G
MKKSELKEYIKEMIISELEGAVNLDKNANPADIKKFTAKGINVNLKENEDEEDEAKLEKKAQAAAKKGGGKVGKLQRVTAQLKELEKEMKELVGKWKKAEGKEKETLLDKLKEKTKVKKELEALEDKLADAIV